MKKTTKIFMVIILMIAIIGAICPKVNADTATLADIVGTFNSQTATETYKQKNNLTYLEAIKYENKDEDGNVTEEGLRITVSENGGSTYYLKYKLDGDILKGYYSGGDTPERTYWSDLTNILIDCIAQLNGHNPGAMYDTLDSSAIANYTVEEQGLFINDTSPYLYRVEIDITKKFPVLDANAYIKVSDLDGIKDALSGDGTANYKKGKVQFYKYTMDDKYILIIGEQDEFTYKINKSIPSVLQVMLDSSDAVDYFKENYPSVSSNKQFDGFKVEVNPIKNSTEETGFGADSTYKYVRITMDKDAIDLVLESKKKDNDGGNNGGGTISNPGDGSSSGGSSSSRKQQRNTSKNRRRNKWSINFIILYFNSSMGSSNDNIN